MDNLQIHEEILTWMNRHAEEDKKAFEERPTKDEMKLIVHDALNDYFSTKGKMTKNFLIASASIIIAISIIFGGFKAILAFFGIVIMGK